MLPLSAWEVADWGVAGGFVLAAIPLILYLIERRRTPVADWPATQFFLAHLKRKIRWMQLKEFLVIILRTFILAGLVAALMRPGEVLRSPAAVQQAGIRGAVILLDNSFSMAAGATESGNSTHWERARARAIEILDDMKPGDLVQVATLAGKPAALSESPLRNLEDAKAAVREAALGGGNSSILAGLDLAAELAEDLPASLREIYLITDLQERGWMLRDEVRWTFVLGRLSGLNPAPSLVLVDVGTENLANRAILGVEVGRPVAGTDRGVEIKALIGQFGDPSPRSVEAVLKVNGEERESRMIQVSQDSEAAVQFHHRFKASGSHRVEIHLRGSDDPFPADDVRYLAVNVVDKLPVLIVAGNSVDPARDSALEGDGDLLDLGLSPRARGLPVPEVLFQPAITSVSAFEKFRFVDLTGYRLILLADVPALSSRTGRLLEDYVRAGGGLLVFAGEKASAPAYNQDLFRGGRGVLPAELAAREEDRDSAERTLSPSGFIEGHPALAAFSELLRSELEKIRVERWWRTEPAPAGTATLAELEPGVPYLLEKGLGRGRIIFFATSARLDDSDLPKRPVFVPLLHGLCFYLASAAEERRTVALGDSLTLRLEDPEPGNTVILEDPDRSVHSLPIQALSEDLGKLGGRAVVRYGPTALPGFYSMNMKGQAGERSFAFAANPDREESDPRRLGPKDLERVTGPLGFIRIREIGELQPSQAGGSIRKEWWRPILAMVVALLVLEVLVTRAFAKGQAPWRPPESNAK